MLYSIPGYTAWKPYPSQITAAHTYIAHIWQYLPPTRGTPHWTLACLFSNSRQTCKRKSRIPCPNFDESRFPGSSQILLPVKTFCVFPNPDRILVKSRILKIPSRPYIKRLFPPRLQNKKGRKGPPDRRLCMLMSLKRRNVKFKPRIKLNHNMLIPQIC